MKELKIYELKLKKKIVFLLCFFFKLECFMLMFDVNICSK